MTNIDEKTEKQRKNLQNYVCWKCKYTWSDESQVEDTVVCPKCGMMHGMITTGGSMIPRGRQRGI